MFGKRLLGAIETAFENDEYSWNDTVTSAEVGYLIKAFAHQSEQHYVVDRDISLLISIFQNIVKHKGKLVINGPDGDEIVFD